MEAFTKMALPLADRVATRHILAGYFNIGDVILFGKWKNHKGKIVAWGKDKYGNPTVEIEPIPKGRKQNKVFGLYRIWRADVKEKALAEQAEKALQESIKTANLAFQVKKLDPETVLEAVELAGGRTMGFKSPKSITYSPGGIEVYLNNEWKVAASGTTLAGLVKKFFEDTAEVLRDTWDAKPKIRVIEKKPLFEYTLEFTVNDPDMFDHKVTCRIDSGLIKYVIEKFTKDRDGVKSKKLGSGASGPDGTPADFARVLERAAAGSDYEY